MLKNYKDNNQLCVGTYLLIYKLSYNTIYLYISYCVIGSKPLLPKMSL